VANKRKVDARAAAVLPATMREPTFRERQLIDGALARQSTRPIRVQVRAKPSDEATQISAPHSDKAGWIASLNEAAGSTSDDFVCRTLDQVTGVLRGPETPKGEADINVGLAVLGAVQPENEIEALLGAQMAATHDVAMAMLAKAKHAQYLEQMDAFGRLGTKLLRTFTAQVEALAKLRRGGEQTVRVEHVHVHSGAQAIVGNVSHPGGGGARERVDQAHATDNERAALIAAGSAVRCPDPERRPVPVTSCARQDPLSNARRSTRKRRTERR
jgi:hypothetical protein